MKLKFRIKKELNPNLLYVKGFLKTGMRLQYTRATQSKYKIYYLLLHEQSELTMAGYRQFHDVNGSGSWTEDYLLDRLKDGSCKIIVDGK